MKKVMAFVKKEFREALLPFIFFFLLFHMIGVTRAAAAGDYSISGLRAAFMTLAALIVAKAILMVEALPVPRFLLTRRVYHVLWKTLLFGSVAILFRLLEEFIPLLRKHHSVIDAATATYRETAWPQFAIMSMWVFGGLLFYCLSRELVLFIGTEKVKQLLFGRSTADTAARP